MRQSCDVTVPSPSRGWRRLHSPVWQQQHWRPRAVQQEARSLLNLLQSNLIRPSELSATSCQPAPPPPPPIPPTSKELSVSEASFFIYKYLLIFSPSSSRPPRVES